MAKNNLFNRYPAIIHGEARGENDEFVLYTRYPRFLARRSFDDTFSGGLPESPIKGEIGTAGGKPAYRSNTGLWLSDFIFLDSKPQNPEAFWASVIEAGNRITADTLMLDEETPEIGAETAETDDGHSPRAKGRRRA